MKKYIGLEAFNKIKRLIVVAAHPDDLETMCGGTIALLIKQGVKVFSVNCTLGDIGSQQADITRSALATRRLTETEEAAKILGLEAVYNLGHPDGELIATLQLRAQLARLYRLTQADALFTFDPFWTGQIHPDHRAAAQAALDAYMPSKMPLYHPEQLNEVGAGLSCLEQVFLFSTTRDPQIFIDISQVYSIKLASSMAHHCQFPEGEKNLDWLKDIDRQKGQVIDVLYAESFKQIDVW